MKRFTALIQLAIAIFFFLTIPLGRAHAWEMVGDFGANTDAAAINNVMNSSAFDLHVGTNQILVPTCLIFPFRGKDNCTDDPQRYQTMLKQSALGGITSGIAMMYDNPPANLAYWIKDTGMSLGFIPRQAYAQGIGFNGLEPLLPIWKAFRNIAYVLLALSMIIVGFMVMLRKRIDPKTVVTVQNALPRIVITLILITFSYAIVGLMIDLMYLIIAFLHFIVGAHLPDSSSFGINYVSGGFFDLFGAVFAPLPKWLAGDIIADVNQGQWGEAIKDYASGLISGRLVFGPLFLFIVAIAYLFAFIRILFMLLGAYVQILLAVLTGPIQLLADVFPGANGFTEWIKNLVSNLIVFPITIFFLMITSVINQYIGEQSLWAPPLLPQGTGGLAETLITLGIIMTIPNIVNGLKESFKAKALVGGGGGGGLGGAVTTLSTLYYAQAMTPKVIKDRVAGLFGGSAPEHPTSN